MTVRPTLGAIAAAILCMPFSVQAFDNPGNPVLPGVCDIGVMRHNGTFYLGGMSTSGGFLTSEDLMHWTPARHVFSMDNEWTPGGSSADHNIHADDIRYIDGKYHLYWSVNYWGRDAHVVHIAHAVSDSVMGPYAEPCKETWMDNRIDPMLFRDDDGKMYMYSVHFSDGNAIWARPMSDPAHFCGDPVFQFSSIPGTWETLDNRVAEGPWVVKYRGRYYMLYNTNHTDTRWGNYHLGVAVADSPMGFGNGGKYPYPIAGTNQTELEDLHRDILRYSDEYDPYFLHSGTCAEGWNLPGFDDSSWSKGLGGFGTDYIAGSTVRSLGTSWKGEEIYLRKHFRLEDVSSLKNLALRIIHDAPTEVWLGGEKIYEAPYGYGLTDLDAAKVSSLLHNGDNVLCIKSVRGGRRAYVNCSLFDMQGDEPGSILMTPGQPNLVKGPNGLEWWLVHMANVGCGARGQHITRAFFSGDRLYLEPMSCAESKYFVSVPSLPSVREQLEGGRTALDGELFVDKELMSPYYHYETMLSGERFELVLARYGDGSEMRISFLPGGRTVRIGDEIHTLDVPMEMSVLHEIVLDRNYGRASVTVDGMAFKCLSDISLPSSSPAVPGVSARNGQRGNIIYTRGWDEYGSAIGGWRDAGDCRVKADPSDCYDFSLKLLAPSEGSASCFPVYVDSRNYVKVTIDRSSSEMRIETCRRGKSKTANVSLACTRPLYESNAYSDMIEHRYFLGDGSTIDRIIVPAHGKGLPGPDTRPAPGFDHGDGAEAGNLLGRLVFKYATAEHSPLTADGLLWEDIEFEVSEDSKYLTASFPALSTRSLRVVNRFGRDTRSLVSRILVHELSRQDNHLHFVRSGEKLVICLEGRQMAEVSLKGFAPSIVGVGSNSLFEDSVYFERIPASGE